MTAPNYAPNRPFGTLKQAVTIGRNIADGSATSAWLRPRVFTPKPLDQVLPTKHNVSQKSKSYPCLCPPLCLILTPHPSVFQPISSSHGIFRSPRHHHLASPIHPSSHITTNSKAIRKLFFFFARLTIIVFRTTTATLPRRHRSRHHDLHPLPPRLLSLNH